MKKSPLKRKAGRLCVKLIMNIKGRIKILPFCFSFFELTGTGRLVKIMLSN